MRWRSRAGGEPVICPASKVLTTTGKLVNDGETLLYRAKTRDCRSCRLKAAVDRMKFDFWHFFGVRPRRCPREQQVISARRDQHRWLMGGDKSAAAATMGAWLRMSTIQFDNGSVGQRITPAPYMSTLGKSRIEK